MRVVSGTDAVSRSDLTRRKGGIAARSTSPIAAKVQPRPVNRCPQLLDHAGLPKGHALQDSRHRVVLIDESHNLRNSEGRRYQAIQEYIGKNGSRCILLSAAPYNKTYIDLSSHLQLFVPSDSDLGIRPERRLKEPGETEFIWRHQCPMRSQAAFEKSECPDDWRDLSGGLRPPSSIGDRRYNLCRSA